MKLKTLKEMVNLKWIAKGDAWELKQEAIKWVKSGNYSERQCHALIHFLNITEKDLKGGERR